MSELSSARHRRDIHKPDHPFRSWRSGARFVQGQNVAVYKQPPPQPIIATIEHGDEGMMAEFWDSPVPLMTKKLFEVLREAGVDNLDSYQAEIHEKSTGKIYDNYVSFNIVGAVSAADLHNSSFDSETPALISRDFDSLAISEDATRSLLCFRLAESVNAIIVHEKVKHHIESSGINTLTFLRPEQWAG